MGIKVRKPKGYRSWCVVIDHNGQRKTNAVGSREAAERVRREIEARLAMGDASPLQAEERSIPTLAAYSKDWLAHIGQRLKPGTVGYYSQYLRLYVMPKFGDTHLDRIERDAIKKFISELADRSLAKNTIRLVITALRAVLSGAIEDGLIDSNPAQRLGRFVKSERPEREATALTAREVGRFLATAKESCPSHYPLFLTAVRAGLREGELAALRWGDIRFGGERRRSGPLYSGAAKLRPTLVSEVRHYKGPAATPRGHERVATRTTETPRSAPSRSFSARQGRHFSGVGFSLRGRNGSGDEQRLRASIQAALGARWTA